MNTVKSIESGFEKFGLQIHRFRWLALGLMILTIFGFVSQMPKTRVDTSNEGFLHEDDPILKTYDAFRDQYGREETIVLAIETPDLFTFETLSKLRDLHRELEANVPYLEKVSSLVNARSTRGEQDRLIVEDLLEDWPQTQADLEAIKQNAFNNEIYQNLLMSEDGKIAVVLVESVVYVGQGDHDALAGFDSTEMDSAAAEAHHMTEEENSEMVIAVNEILGKYQADDFNIHQAGTPIVIENLKNAMQSDMQSFTKNSLLLVLLVLGVMFRRISGVLMPLVVVIASIISTFGAMAATGVALKMPTQILPSFILAVSVASSVHILVRFYREYNVSHNKREAIGKTLGHSGLAVCMTSLTTAAGLLSFAGSQISPISDLGIFAGFAVGLVLLYNLVLLPTLLAVFPIFKKKIKTSSHRSIIDKALLAVARFSMRNYRSLSAIGIVVFLLGAAFASKIEFRHDPLEWMPQDWETVQSTYFVDKTLKGSTTTEIVIDTQSENGLHSPELLKSMDALQHELVESQYGIPNARVGKAYSVVDIVKETNRALNANNQAAYRIPDTQKLIAQELLLFEDAGSEDLQDFVDSQFSQARMSLKTPWIDAGSSALFLGEIDQKLESIRKLNPDYEAHITGMGPLFVRTLSAAIESMRDSYLIAFVIITIMMCALMGSFKIGLVSILPNIMPVALALGVMSLMGIPLDLFTMLVGSISIGLAVDDTIHFIQNFKRSYAQSGDVYRAIEETFLTAGRAILVTTLVLCAGFFVFMGATMHNVVIFGALIGSTILVALVADLVITPALLVMLYGKKSVPQENNQPAESNSSDALEV